MSNTDPSIHTGQRTSLFNIFKEKGLKIEIPIIQRDYAQGRDSSSELRVMFLDALFQYLNGDLPNRDLDFVYGSLETNEDPKFIPLDGQQRLTTLFLLHWYLANLAGKSEEFRQVLCHGKHSRFTYETRSSSREFCNELVTCTFSQNNLLKPDPEKKNSLSKTIRDFGWYQFAWDRDPTIQSMLNMLDSIHLRFAKNPNFYDKLTDDENPYITFYFLNLKDFRLTDDLYIKMNSRGLPLSPFENFKAKFEQLIARSNFLSNKKYELVISGIASNVSTDEYFSHNIDNKWADLFWNYREAGKNNDTFDEELMNFIRVVLTNQYALNLKTDSSDDFEFLLRTNVARQKDGYSDSISFYKFKGIGALTDEAISVLIETLDNLCNGSDPIKIYLPNFFYFDENQTFREAITHSIAFTQRIRFYAYTQFLNRNQKNTNGLDQWMRVIYNLTENTEINGADDFGKAIKSVHGILNYSSDIFTHLKKTNLKIEFFFSKQVQEEKIKAHLISKSKLWKDEIERIEMHPYFKGQIGFILEFSGILEYFETNKDLAWDSKTEEAFWNSFLNYAQKSSVVFNEIQTNKIKDYLWERAVLSKGDYLISSSNSRFNFLSTSKNMRDFSWKRLLRLPVVSDYIEGENWKSKRGFVKEVLDDLEFDSNNLGKSLSKIIKSKPKDWRRYFIENPELIRYCEQGFIRFEGETKITLFRQSQQNHNHREMFTYNLTLMGKAKIRNFLPFTNFDHKEVRSSGEDSYAYLIGWKYQNKEFSISIYFDNEKEFLPNPFEIKFSKVKGEKGQKEYPPNLIKVLKSNQFVWDNDTKGFWISEKSEQKTLTRIQGLCTALNAF